MGPIDSTDEFDASIYTAEYVTAGVDEPLEEILERVEETWLRSPNVVLVIPRGCKAFKETHDFLALGKLPGARQVRVSVASSDMTVTGLARVLGFHSVELAQDHPMRPDDPDFGLPNESDIEKPTSPLPLGSWERIVGGGTVESESGWVVQQAVLAVPKKSSLTTSTWLTDPADYDALAPSLATPIKHRSGPLTDDKRTGRLASTLLEDASSDPTSQASVNAALRTPHSAFRTTTTPSGRIKARSVLAPDVPTPMKAPRKLKYGVGDARPFRWGRLAGVVSGLLVVAIVGSLFYAFAYLPEATVTLVPQSTNLNQPVEIIVLTADNPPSGRVGLHSPLRSTQYAASPSEILTATITALPISAPIDEEGTRPASGERQEARGRAQGTMSFVNTNEQAVSIQQGTQFRAANGAIVEVTRGGTVPATVFGQKFGELTLPVGATVDGPEGNLKEGALAGEWRGLKYYSSALEGGSLETIKVVTQEDIDGLTAQLQAQAERRLYGAIAEQVGEGQKLITQTVRLADVAVIADHKAGEDGAEVTERLTSTARAFVFSEREMREAVVDAVVEYVQRTEQPIAGPELVLSTVNFAVPSAQSVAEGRAVYTTRVSGRIAYRLTENLTEAIRALVKGKSIQQARSEILSRYERYVKPANVQAKVLWFNVDRLPTDPARINVLPAGAPSGGGP